ncbi:MAG: PH domain-containing protein [Patescibacteria group bacterium]|nr:PH domain-containing protein [Patescibacteria group bacterium]
MQNTVTLYRTVKTDDAQTVDTEERSVVIEPIRESLVLFVIKIALILIVTDLVYATLNFVLLRAFFLNHELPFRMHSFAPYVLTFLHLVKTTLQVWGISAIVFRWVGNSYHITDKHLVHHEGVINCNEKIYDLDIVRSVSIQQSWLGKIFRYGTVNIEISASGGYTDQVTLFGVSNPQQYEKMLRRHF